MNDALLILSILDRILDVLPLAERLIASLMGREDAPADLRDLVHQRLEESKRRYAAVLAELEARLAASNEPT